MRIGDLVRYKGWEVRSDFVGPAGPVAIVLETRMSEVHYHNRIRVMWLDDPAPIQAKVFSTTGDRISTWINPRHFEVIGECSNESR